MHIIDTLPSRIKLGQQNEHGICEVEFDVTAWVALYPTGATVVAATPGVSNGLWMTYTRETETDVYPVAAADLALSTVDDVNILTWTVQEAVTALGGIGTVVIHCTEDGDEKRSGMTQTVVADGHAASTTPPEPLATYLQKLSAIDIVVTEVTPGEADGTVSMDSTGIHIALDIPSGAEGADGVVWVNAPVTSTSTGTAGQTAYDNGYVYVCVAANSWKRCELVTWGA